MKFGLVPVNVGVNDVESMIALSQKAEQVGVESLWTFEHVIVPLDYESKYPYDPSGKMAATPEANFVDPLIALTAIAAHTKTIRLATGVNILPQRNPIYLAKQAASLDFVSGGRFMLGVGIGWLREEFDALGVPFERRGARFDDYVEGMKKIWSGDTVEHQSDFLHWSGFKSYPLPKNLPIVIGGTKGKAFERIARHGDGWFAPTINADMLKPSLALLEEACKSCGRDPATVEITAMFVPAMGADVVKAYEDVGVSRLVTPLPALGGPPLEALDQFAEDVVAKLG